MSGTYSSRSAHQQLDKLLARRTCACVVAASGGRTALSCVSSQMSAILFGYVLATTPVITKAPFLGLTGLTTMGMSGISALTPRSTAPARVLKQPHDVLRRRHAMVSNQAVPSGQALLCPSEAIRRHSRQYAMRSSDVQRAQRGDPAETRSQGVRLPGVRMHEWHCKARAPPLDRQGSARLICSRGILAGCGLVGSLLLCHSASGCFRRCHLLLWSHRSQRLTCNANLSRIAFTKTTRSNCVRSRL